MKIVCATDALYALCARVPSAGYSRGTPTWVLSVRAEASALQRRRLQHCAPDRRCRMLQRHALRCGEALEGGKGLCGREPSRAAPSRAFNQVERSIADEYTVETELPRQHCRGWPKDRVPLRAELLCSGTASRAPVIRTPRMMRCTTTNSLYAATASRLADSDWDSYSDSDSDGPLARSRRDPAAHRVILPTGPSANSAVCPPTFTRCESEMCA